MNIELTAHTTKLLHLSVMDLCSMWSHQLCPRNPGLVFGFATDLLCEFGLITLSCCASLFSLPCCCPSLATYVQWGCLRTGIGFCCAQKMLFSILTFAKATSKLIITTCLSIYLFVYHHSIPAGTLCILGPNSSQEQLTDTDQFSSADLGRVIWACPGSPFVSNTTPKRYL